MVGVSYRYLLLYTSFLLTALANRALPAIPPLKMFMMFIAMFCALEFHRKYYVDYCQYKHGLAVALSPAENPIMKGDAERINSILKKPEKCGLWTFHQGTVGDYEKRTGSLQALGIILKQDMQAHVRELHDEGIQ